MESHRTKPYLEKSLAPWGLYPPAREGKPEECFNCTYNGPGTAYCHAFQEEELERQREMYLSGKEPETTEQFFLDCPKALQERKEGRQNRPLWEIIG